MKQPELTVFIVDDDPAVRDSLALLLGLRGYRTAVFADAESFLKAYQTGWRGCLLLDIRMPGIDGLALQERLLQRRCEIPVVVVTAHGDVTSARAAFRSRAIDFLEKPVDDARLLAAIEEAFRSQAVSSMERDRRETFNVLVAELTPREREVMKLVVAGHHNREIAQLLGISARTVEVHKARMMNKLGVDNLAALVRLSLNTGADDA